MSFLQITRDDRDVAEQTKPHRAIWFCVMSRRTSRGKCTLHSAAHYRVGCDDRAAEREHRDLITVRSDRSITKVQKRLRRVSQTCFTRCTCCGVCTSVGNDSSAGTGVSSSSFSPPSGFRPASSSKSGNGSGESTSPAIPNRAVDRADPVRPLRVMRAGHVLDESRTGAEAVISRPNLLDPKPLEPFRF